MSDAFEFSQEHRSPFNHFHFFDKTTRLIAGPQKVHRDLEPTKMSTLVVVVRQTFPRYFILERSSVEMAGFEPATFALQRRCSPAELHPQATYLVGLTGFEPVTPALSAQCSNQLSYKPEGCSASTTEK